MRVRAAATFSCFCTRSLHGSLAEAHASLNDRGSQLQLLQRALRIQETVFGPDHEEVKLTLEELAEAYGRCVGLLCVSEFAAVVVTHSRWFSSGDAVQQRKCQQRADAIAANSQ